MLFAFVLVSSVVSADLVCYYKFEEGIGIETADDSGTGNTGYLYKATGLTPPLWSDDTPPIYGGNHSLYFPGGANVGRSTNASLEITGNLSIHAFVKTMRFADVGPIVAKWATGMDNSYLLHVSEGTLAFTIADITPPTTDTLTYTPTVDEFSVGKWFHLAAIYSQDDMTMSLYMDGREVASKATTVPAIRPTLAPLHIGKYNNSHYDGFIDEVKIYNSVVPPDFPDPTPDPSTIPEPATLLLIGMGIIIRRKRPRRR